MGSVVRSPRGVRPSLRRSICRPEILVAKNRLLLCSFLLNLGLLLLHELDAVFWQEWRLFGFTDDEFGRKLFILVHLPLFVFLLSGLLNLESRFGKLVSLVLSSFLVVHLFLHASSLGQGRFHGLFSSGIILAMFVVSVVQSGATVSALVHDLRKALP